MFQRHKIPTEKLRVPNNVHPKNVGDVTRLDEGRVRTKKRFQMKINVAAER